MIGTASLSATEGAFMETVQEIQNEWRRIHRVPSYALQRDVAKRLDMTFSAVHDVAVLCHRRGLIEIHPGLNCEMYGIIQ